MNRHHETHPHPHKPRADLSHFYVITPITNQWRYKRRYELYWKFKELCEQAGVNLVTIEIAFGERPHMVTGHGQHSWGNSFEIQLKSHEELWHKENLINVAVQHIMQRDPLAKKIAWVDADCFPMIPMREWFEETWHYLEHYEFVQMWEWLINFAPNSQRIGDLHSDVIGTPQLGFMASYQRFGFKSPIGAYAGKQKTEYTDDDKFPKQLGRPGLAWAANIDAFNKVGGLVDFCILGSGDWHMAHALIGAMSEQTTLVGTLRGHGSQEYAMAPYTEALLDWQKRCERWIKRDVGFIPVTVGHWWHGKYKDRRYGSRGKILVECNFNPYTDVKKDAQGVQQLETWEPRQIELRDRVRHYFATRDEDSTDM